MRAFLLCLTLLAGPAAAQTLTRVANVTVMADPLDIAAMGTTAYLANFGDNTLQVYDLQTPPSPALRSTTTAGVVRARNVVAAGTTVYVTGYGIGVSTSSQLQAFDVSIPTTPVARKQVQLGAPPVYVAASTSRVCVSNSAAGTLQVYDADLNLQSTLTGVAYSQLALSGTTVYAQAGSQVTVYDLSIATAPVKGATFSGAIAQVAGPQAFGLSGSTLLVYDVSKPLAPVLQGSVATNGGTLLAVSGTTVFTTGLYSPVGGSSSPLQAFDVSTPTAPVLRATAGAGTTAVALAAGGGAAYLLNPYTTSLQVYAVGSVTATRPASAPAWQLYPNPAHGFVRLGPALAAAAQTIISDLSGRVCLTAATPGVDQELDIRSLAPGLYLVRTGNQVRQLTVE